MNQNNYWKHNTAEVDPEAVIGEGTKIWNNSQVLKNAQIGQSCNIGHNCFIGSKAKIGNNVKIQSNTDVWDLVELEDYVFVGPSAVFTNDPMPRAKYPDEERWQKTLVRQGVTIGANATILCGITIGENAFIGAASLVNKDVVDYALMVGVPARQIGWVCECGNRLEFENNQAVCQNCQKQYIQENDKVFRSNKRI